MDETLVLFDSPVNKIVDQKGVRQVPLLTQGNHRKRITAVLTATSNGKLLPPCIIEDGKSKAACNSAGDTRYQLNGINVWKQKNHTMTSHIMVDWIRNYLAPMFPLNERKLIIMDSIPNMVIVQPPSVNNDRHKSCRQVYTDLSLSRRGSEVVSRLILFVLTIYLLLPRPFLAFINLMLILLIFFISFIFHQIKYA